MGVTIAPKTAQVTFAGHVQFTAAVVGLSTTTVAWTVKEGSMGGTVSSTGLYIAPSISGVFHVTATSTSDASESDTATITVSAPAGTPPVLTAGVWTNITPPALMLLGSNFGTPWIEIDPSNPRTLYVCADQEGMWKTTDGGSSWALLGDPSAANTGTTTTYLDSPIAVRVDPGNSQHLYATQGVRGMTMGFWVSTDGGSSWTIPMGFQTVAAATLENRDVTQFDVDPSDFKHIILGSHSAWIAMGLTNAGLFESMDGGDSWVIHLPLASWASGSMGIHFLYNPGLALGNAQTWFVGESKFWRTTDSGTTWTNVSSYGITHGGNDFYYTAAGVLYAGAAIYPVRSTDNGVTWEQLTQGPGYSYYYSIQGDGTSLYTQISFTGTNNATTDGVGATPAPYLTSKETDGLTWVPYQGGKQTFLDGPFVMRFDPGNRIMYSANWDAGVWALKVLNP
jgi:hypothetical protein